MADALASGASVRKDVGVQVPPRPQGNDLFTLKSFAFVFVEANPKTCRVSISHLVDYAV